MAKVERRPRYRLHALCAGCGIAYKTHWQHEIEHCAQLARERGWKLDTFVTGEDVLSHDGVSHDLCKDCAVPGRSI